MAGFLWMKGREQNNSKFFSYILKFGCYPRFKSHLSGIASSYMKEWAKIFNHIWRRFSSWMTFHPIFSELPYFFWQWARGRGLGLAWSRQATYAFCTTGLPPEFAPPCQEFAKLIATQFGTRVQPRSRWREKECENDGEGEGGGGGGGRGRRREVGRKGNSEMQKKENSVPRRLFVTALQ